MADPKRALEANAKGEFFVDSTCINCGTCRKFAPAVFGEADSTSYVAQQPSNEISEILAMRSLISCPVAAIGLATKKVPREVLASFPLRIDGNIYVNGFNSEDSYGADSYFIQDDGGNWLIDSPRFTPVLCRRFQELGGIKYIFLTHRDDVAEAEKYANEFGSARIIHRLDLDAQPEAEVILDGKDDSVLGDAKIIFSPGHTAGHCVLLWKNKYLFTGDHLPWSEKQNGFRPFQRSCWFSWNEQIKSVSKLGVLSGVEWILPGHGERTQMKAGSFPRLIEEAVAWMVASASGRLLSR
jgi:glyoxylase-like metal-dependent hydrolase (beta-lactamase superfamily II)/ferredoxin